MKTTPGTIYIVCGLIGAGKSTWARENFTHVTEFEQTGEKAKQITQSILMRKSGDVAHITTVPTQRERLLLEQYPHKYILIDTDFVQAKKNIVQRNRPQDITGKVWNANTMIGFRLASSNIDFEHVTIDFNQKNTDAN